MPVHVLVFVYYYCCLSPAKSPGLPSTAPFEMRPRRWAILDGLCPIGSTMQGITAEVFPAWAVPFALGLSRRADSDTLVVLPYAGLSGKRKISV